MGTQTNNNTTTRTRRASWGRFVRTVMAIVLVLSFLAGAQAAGAAVPDRPIHPGGPVFDQPGPALDPGAPTQPGGPVLPPVEGRPAEEVVREALASPDLVRVVDGSELERVGLDMIRVAPGGQLDLAQFVTATSLRRDPAVGELFSRRVQRLLGTTAKYDETIIELEDRVLIDREVTVKPRRQRCGSRPRAALREYCITVDPSEEISSGMAADLDAIRDELASKPPRKRIAGRVRVRHALAMSDAELLDLLVNGSARSIRRLTVLPKADTGGRGAVDAGALVPRVNAATVVAPTSPASRSLQRFPWFPGGPRIDLFTGDPRFDTNYFLTGFTFGEEHKDTWEYTIAKKTWWHGRYYVKFDYEFGFGFGVRAPFSVDVTHQSGGPTDPMELTMEVAPVDVAADGSPAYPEVGLAETKTFKGREFVLEARATCKLKISIPGPDPKTMHCPEFDRSYSRDIDPVIGSERSNIESWWLRGGEETPLELELGVGGAKVAWAALDIGVDADVTNGRIGMRVDALGATELDGGLHEGMVWFDSREPVAFTAERRSPGSDFGFTVSDPRYSFDISLRPKIRGRVGLDVRIIEKEWTLGPWSLDFLEFGHGFDLGHHDGTVASHHYDLEPQPLVFDRVAVDRVQDTVERAPSSSPASVHRPSTAVVTALEGTIAG